jgi:hypothetical protein
MADIYNSANYSQHEQEMMKKFHIQLEDAKNYFVSIIKPRLDRSYKLYIADNTDRAREIKSWQANVAIPYIHAVVETLKPRILDARPEFTVQGRNPDDQIRAAKIQSLGDYGWEVAEGDKVAELLSSSSLIFGMGYLQVGWRKDVRTLNFLASGDISSKKYKWEEKSVTFYDAPFVDWVDNYQLWYDWHNINAKSKQYWFKRLILTEPEIKRLYPMAEKKRLEMAFESNTGDLTDYGSVRNQVKLSNEKITRGTDFRGAGNSL